MNLYTFIVDYDGGTYISQCRAGSVARALDAWFLTNQGPDFPAEIKLIRPSKFYEIEKSIVAISNIHNVWYFSGLMRNILVGINIVLTKD